MLSFRALSEKKTKIKINPKQSEITEMENNHGEDCDCMKCERKRRKGEKEPEVANESAVPGKPAERLGAVTAIPKDERDAAAERLKAKAAAKRKAKGIEEGYYDPMEDPDFDHDEAERTRGQSGKNKSITIKKKTKKTTKTEDVAYVSQEEVSEESNQSIAETETLLTFGQFNEATRAAKEGKKDEHRVGVEIRAKQSAATLAAKRARQKVLDAHEKKTGKKLDISKTPEGKKHAQHFGGSRQEKKVKGAKETPLETHNRRVGRDTLRKLKHGKTSKEKKYDAAMAKHTSRFD